MYTKLAAITTQYSKFTKNQVLTEAQLNEFLEYFEDQDHLSRIALSGVGIGCGFNIAYSKTKTNAFSISKGFGVTTDGDLLTLVEPKDGKLRLLNKAFKTYTHYRTFEDSNAKYPHFIQADDSQIDLIEVFSDEDIDTDDSGFTRLTSEQLDNKVVLLYLENYPKEGDLCTALDCDNQGQLQVSKLRVLLVSTEDAASMAARDSIYTKHNWYDLYKGLPEIEARRDILSARNTTNYDRLKSVYYSLIHTSKSQKIQRIPRSPGIIYKQNDESLLSKLSKGFDEIFNKFGKDSISPLISGLFNINPTAVPRDFQYVYDALKDLIDTYNEIKALLLHINVECSPDITSFPKHLMLGKLEQDPQPQVKILRHRFYKSPIIGNEDDNLKKVISLLNRTEHILKHYLATGKGDDIKITPSKLEGELGNQAIPFYFDVTKTFLDHWSFEKYQNLEQNTNLSYHTGHLSQAHSVQEPLYYNLDNFNFLRIEGIQGKSYKDAFDQVMELKEKFGLNFDVKVLPLGVPNQRINMSDYRCEFEDLEVLLEAWTTEQECILVAITNFFSGFKLDLKSKDDDTNDGGKVYYLDNVTEATYTNAKDYFYTTTWAKSNANVIKEFTAKTEKTAREMSSYDKMRSLNEPIYMKAHETIKPLNKSVVKDSLIQEENTLGYYVSEAIVENEGGCESVNDILSNAKAKVKTKLQSEAWEANPEAKDFILHDAVNLLVNAHMLSHSIPVTVKEIDRNTIDRYKRTLDDVCSLVKNLRVRFQRAKLSETQNKIIALLINQLAIVCCSGKKLDILQKEIEKRKENILKRIQLSEFVKQHPGLRHYAGVPVGGTFVMAYLRDDAEGKSTYETSGLEVEFLKQPSNRGNIEFNGGQILLWDEKLSMTFEFIRQINRDSANMQNQGVIVGRTLEATVSNLAEFLNFRWKLAGASTQCRAIARDRSLLIELIDQKVPKDAYYIQFFNPAITGSTSRVFFDPNEVIRQNITAKNTVIADFALPYMCCSDCTPVNFVVPKEPVSLSLPEPYVCLNENTTPIPFTVKPEDGEVKAVVKEGLSAGVTQDENGAYQFDARQVNPALIGKPIRFTVNDEETTAVITVYESPQAVITASPDEFIYNDMKTSVRVPFKVSGSGISFETEFEWDFGDGSDIQLDKPDENRTVWHTYNLPVNDENTVNPKIRVSNGSCVQEIDMDGITFDEPTQVSLDIQDTYCYDIGLEQQVIRIPFTTINPQNGIIEIASANQSDVLSIDQAKKELVITNPWDFKQFDTPIGFTLNGMPTNAQIRISRKPSVYISSSSDEPYWENGVYKQRYVFSARGDDGSLAQNLSFKWYVEGENEGDQNPFEYTFETNNQEARTFKVSLVAASENGCEREVTTDVTIEPEQPQNCSDEAKAAILNDKTSLESDNVSSIDNFDINIYNGTVAAYKRVTKNASTLNAFVAGGSNNALKRALSKIILNTSNAILKAASQGSEQLVALYTRYFKFQFRLFFNIIKCQEDIPDNEIEKHILPVLKAMMDALTNLSDFRFDYGTPDPQSDEGTLRKYLSEYLEAGNLQQPINDRIQQMIGLILAP